jgi:hypothetical protein
VQRRCSWTTSGQSLAHKTNPMRRWIDEVSFLMRVVLLVLVVVITIAVIGWDMIEFSARLTLRALSLRLRSTLMPSPPMTLGNCAISACNGSLSRSRTWTLRPRRPLSMASGIDRLAARVPA